jgi:hypothetical protein
MTTLVLVVIAGLLSLAALAVVVRGRISSATTLSRLHECTTPVDLDAFRNLIDPENEEFFRRRLEAGQYRQFRKKRDRVALAYLRLMASNAAVVLHVSEPLRSSSDEATRVAAERVVGVALRLRINSLLAMARLRFFLILPIPRSHPTRFVMDYPSFVSAVMYLVMLQNPRETSLVMSAL